MKIVLTGGPSAGKTTVATSLIKEFGTRLAMVPEAASILYKGGFPRVVDTKLKVCQQRAIYRVQVELENIRELEWPEKFLVCDRGTLDGLAYWPMADDEFFANNLTDLNSEMNRYDLVIHLDVAKREDYNSDHSNIRVETFEQALEIDEKIKKAWSQHPNRILVGNNKPFWQRIEEVHEIVHKTIEES